MFKCKPWVEKYLSQKQIDEVSDVVQLAEAKTMGEVVPVIVQRSSAIRHIPLSISLVLLVVFIFIESAFTEALHTWMGLMIWPLAFAVFFTAGNWLTHFFCIQRVFTPNQDEAEQVFARAQLEFYLNRVNHTSASTGILIFISAMERRAIILADKSINEKVTQEVWDKVTHKMIQTLKTGDWSLALKQAVEDCGAILATHFPSQASNPNELSNKLIIK